MMRWTLALTVSLTAISFGHGQSPLDLGPGDGGATLKQPWQDAPRPATPRPDAPRSAGDPLKGLWNPAAAPATQATPTLPSMPSMPVDINQDLAVTPQLGPWMVFIHSYTGPEAPTLARQMTLELRNTYKLPAFVFNYVAEEKRKEFQRIREQIEKQRAFAQQNNLPLADNKIRVKTMRIQDHCGILIGGYASEEAARRALADVKKLTPPDPTRVALDMQFYVKEDTQNQNKATAGEHVYVNPFLRARIATNPTTRKERPAEWDKLDVAALRQMNSEEPFSLLQCRRNYTLAIKEFVIPAMLQDRTLSRGGFLASVGIGKGTFGDVSAENAHGLAEALRKGKLEAYVLHTKHASIVTVGGFEGPDDPNLRSMQALLETRLKDDHLRVLELFPRPMPMPIPH